MAKQPCNRAGCPHLVDRGYCDEHKTVAPAQTLDRWRGTSHSRGYDRDWRRIRGLALKRDEHLCVDCKQRGALLPASEVHHLVPVTVWPEGRLLLRNLRSLCHTCHMRATDMENRISAEGWGVKILEILGRPQTRPKAHF